MTEEEFKELLRKHDWTFAFSDDNRVYQAGSASLRRIQGIVKSNPEFNKLYEEERKKAFGITE